KMAPDGTIDIQVDQEYQRRYKEKDARTTFQTHKGEVSVADVAPQNPEILAESIAPTITPVPEAALTAHGFTVTKEELLKPTIAQIDFINEQLEIRLHAFQEAGKAYMIHDPYYLSHDNPHDEKGRIDWLNAKASDLATAMAMLMLAT